MATILIFKGKAYRVTTPAGRAKSAAAQHRKARRAALRKIARRLSDEAEVHMIEGGQK